MPLTQANRDLFVELAFKKRLEELAPVSHLVRQGICEIAPIPIVDLMPISALERLVSGQPRISIEALKQVARYRNSEVCALLIEWFWQV